MPLRLPLHGRNHHPARSDPISEMIVYNYLNKGRWLSIETTEMSDVEAGISNRAGLHIVVGEGQNTGAGDFELITGRDWNVDGIGNDFNLAMGNDFNISPGNDINCEGGNDYNWGPGRDFNVSSPHTVSFGAEDSGRASLDLHEDGRIVFETDTGGILKYWNEQIVFGLKTLMELRGSTQTDTIMFRVHTGKRLVVFDQNDNPIFRIHDDGTVHIKTGGTIVADL